MAKNFLRFGIDKLIDIINEEASSQAEEPKLYGIHKVNTDFIDQVISKGGADFKTVDIPKRIKVKKDDGTEITTVDLKHPIKRTVKGPQFKAALKIVRDIANHPELSKHLTPTHLEWWAKHSGGEPTDKKDKSSSRILPDHDIFKPNAHVKNHLGFIVNALNHQDFFKIALHKITFDEIIQNVASHIVTPFPSKRKEYTFTGERAVDKIDTSPKTRNRPFSLEDISALAAGKKVNREQTYLTKEQEAAMAARPNKGRKERIERLVKRDPLRDILSNPDKHSKEEYHRAYGALVQQAVYRMKTSEEADVPSVRIPVTDEKTGKDIITSSGRRKMKWISKDALVSSPFIDTKAKNNEDNATTDIEETAKDGESFSNEVDLKIEELINSNPHKDYLKYGRVGGTLLTISDAIKSLKNKHEKERPAFVRQVHLGIFKNLSSRFENKDFLSKIKQLHPKEQQIINRALGNIGKGLGYTVNPDFTVKTSDLASRAIKILQKKKQG